MGELVELFSKKELTKMDNGDIVPVATNKYEYMLFCKDLLEDDDYVDVLAGIMDKEYYKGIEPDLQDIVDCYFTHTD